MNFLGNKLSLFVLWQVTTVIRWLLRFVLVIFLAWFEPHCQISNTESGDCMSIVLEFLSGLLYLYVVQSPQRGCIVLEGEPCLSFHFVELSEACSPARRTGPHT